MTLHDMNINIDITINGTVHTTAMTVHNHGDGDRILSCAFTTCSKSSAIHFCDILRKIIPQEVDDWNTERHPEGNLHVVPSIIAEWTNADIHTLGAFYFPHIPLQPTETDIDIVNNLQRGFQTFCDMNDVDRDLYIHTHKQKVKQMIAIMDF